MATFVRKNLLKINATFTPPGWTPAMGIPTQPTSAVAVLKYEAIGGGIANATIPMTLGMDGLTWSCEWDSSASAEGKVDWVIYASGATQAAQQGAFFIAANTANVF